MKFLGLDQLTREVAKALLREVGRHGPSAASAGEIIIRYMDNKCAKLHGLKLLLEAGHCAVAPDGIIGKLYVNGQPWDWSELEHVGHKITLGGQHE